MRVHEREGGDGRDGRHGAGREGGAQPGRGEHEEGHRYDGVDDGEGHRQGPAEEQRQSRRASFDGAGQVEQMHAERDQEGAGGDGQHVLEGGVPRDGQSGRRHRSRL